MAYVIKNASKTRGSVKIKDKWRHLAPGESFKVTDVPVCKTFNIKVISMPDVPVIKARVEPVVNNPAGGGNS